MIDRTISAVRRLLVAVARSGDGGDNAQSTLGSSHKPLLTASRTAALQRLS